MRPFVTRLLACLIAMLSTSVAHATRILVLGDSYAQRSGNYLALDCDGTTVVNRGVGDSTAAEWAGGYCDNDAGWYSFKDGQGCSATDAFSSKYGSGYTRVWFSIGGNDYIYSGCMMPELYLIRLIKSAIVKIRDAAPQGAKILMTGYCIPPGPLKMLGGLLCSDPHQIKNLNGAIKAACHQIPECTFVDATSACGGSDTRFSEPKLFADGIHVNQFGYSRIFAMPGVQSFFGCGYPVASLPLVQTTVTPFATPREAPRRIPWQVWMLLGIAVVLCCCMLCGLEVICCHLFKFLKPVHLGQGLRVDPEADSETEREECPSRDEPTDWANAPTLPLMRDRHQFPYVARGLRDRKSVV